MFASVTFQGLLAVALISLISLVGAASLGFARKLLERGMLYIIGFSTGAIFGDIFLHILPEMAEEGTVAELSVYILLGVLLSFILEKFLHWHHCHKAPNEKHHHPVGVINLVGDGLHNMIDGVLIASAFMVDTQIGWATTIAVALHEIPQEIGDYAILVYSGHSHKKALLFNFYTALSAIVGACLVFFVFEGTAFATYALPIAAGNLLYIAGSDLIPELHKETKGHKSIIQFVMMCAGIGVMALMLLAE